MLENLIPGLVTKPVVDMFESVQVHHDEAEGMAQGFCQSQLTGQPLVYRPVVQAAGDRVSVRELSGRLILPGKLILSPCPLGNVRDDGDPTHDKPAPVDHGRQPHVEGARWMRRYPHFFRRIDRILTRGAPKVRPLGPHLGRRLAESILE